MSRSMRRTASHPLVPLLVLALVLVGAGLGLAGDPNALAPRQQATYPEKGGNYDYFVTIPKETALELRGELALPPDFFAKGSARFEGRVAFKGAPLGSFGGRKAGNADCVIARSGMPKLGTQYPSRGTADIEVVALALASLEPVKVTVGGRSEAWDVKLQLSQKKRSQGKMTIVQKDARGGTFDAQFTVYPLLTFVRQGDKAERKLDVGGLKLSRTANITLKSTAVPWSTRSPAVKVVQTGNFFPGVLDDRLIVIRHEPYLHVIELAIPELGGPGPLGGR